MEDKKKKPEKVAHSFYVTVEAASKVSAARVQTMLQALIDNGQELALDSPDDFNDKDAAIAGYLGIKVRPIRKLFLIVDNDNGDVFPQGLFISDKAETFKQGKALLDTAVMRVRRGLDSARRAIDEWNYDDVQKQLEASGCTFFPYEEIAEG